MRYSCIVLFNEEMRCKVRLFSTQNKLQSFWDWKRIAKKKTQETWGKKLVTDHIHTKKICYFTMHFNLHNTQIMADKDTFNSYFILHSEELILITYLSLMDTRKSLGVEENNSWFAMSSCFTWIGSQSSITNLGDKKEIINRSTSPVGLHSSVLYFVAPSFTGYKRTLQKCYRIRRFITCWSLQNQRQQVTELKTKDSNHHLSHI